MTSADRCQVLSLSQWCCYVSQVFWDMTLFCCVYGS